MARPRGPFTILTRPPRQGDMRSWERFNQDLFQILTGEPGIAWDVVDKTGSDLTDIETRNHNDLQFNRKTKTVDYTILYTDDTIFGDATAGMITIWVPTAIGDDDGVAPHAIKKIDDSINLVRVRPIVSGQKIDREDWFDLEWQDESINIESDGANWRII